MTLLSCHEKQIPAHDIVKALNIRTFSQRELDLFESNHWNIPSSHPYLQRTGFQGSSLSGATVPQSGWAQVYILENELSQHCVLLILGIFLPCCSCDMQRYQQAARPFRIFSQVISKSQWNYPNLLSHRICNGTGLHQAHQRSRTFPECSWF